MIKFNNIKAGFNFTDPVFFRNWLKIVLVKEGKSIPGDIQYVFCDDAYLFEINKKYLRHETLTDIITFPSNKNKEEIISGEIYISVDRVKENAREFKHSFHKEFSRVLVHGILHLLGYADKTAYEKSIMRSKEDYYLTLQPPKNS